MSWTTGFAAKYGFLAVRIFLVVCGTCSILWAMSTIVTYRSEATFASTAQHILLGERYTAQQLDELKLQLDAMQGGSLRPSTLISIATIRLRLAETSLASGNPDLTAHALDDLETATTVALADNPTTSFLWLAQFWLRNARTEPRVRDVQLLRMSYLLGPYEAWIALKRNPLALSVFSSLPEDLEERAIAEFVGLVRSGLSSDAANIFVGAGWPVHDRLLSRLAPLDEGYRRQFGKALDSKNLEGVVVPGAEERPSRPF